MEGIEKGYLEEVDKAAKCYLEALTGNNGVEWAEEDVGRLNAMSAAMLRDRGFNVRYPDSGTLEADRWRSRQKDMKGRTDAPSAFIIAAVGKA